MALIYYKYLEAVAVRAGLRGHQAGYHSRQTCPDRLVTGAELSEAYELGRTPVREALSRLARERLIRILPRRGYLVVPIDVHDVLNMYAVRLLLESEAARLAAGHVNAEQLQRLDAVCRAGYDPNAPRQRRCLPCGEHRIPRHGDVRVRQRSPCRYDRPAPPRNGAADVRGAAAP